MSYDRSFGVLSGIIWCVLKFVKNIITFYFFVKFIIFEPTESLTILSATSYSLDGTYFMSVKIPKRDVFSIFR